MHTPHPFMDDAQGRRFACSAVAVQAIIVDADERILLLSSPTWNLPNDRRLFLQRWSHQSVGQPGRKSPQRPPLSILHGVDGT